jgi:hypothetical protein
MDRASHRFGKCSECREIICVEKAVTDGPSTLRQTNETKIRATGLAIPKAGRDAPGIRRGTIPKSGTLLSVTIVSEKSEPST